MTVSLRPATLDDLDAIDTLEAASFEADRFPRRNLRRMLAGGRTKFILAERGSTPLGYLALSFRRGSQIARLYSLAVADAARGQGVGRRLIAAALECARAENCHAVRLEVRASNEAAKRLYTDCGFTLRGERKNYYGDGEAALLFEAETGRGAKEGAPS